MTEHIQPPLVQVRPLPTIDTSRLFRPAPEVLSPIDKFIANTNAINRILSRRDSEGEPSPELCSVVVLGYLSAVETYFRTLLSRLVHLDPISQRSVGQKTILFSVAMSRPRETLAEALFEDSFASTKELKARLLEIGMSNLPQEIQSALREYEKICHVRHCCVHRFGYLGTANARALGMSEHHHLIGGLFAASMEELGDIADALQQFVKTCNNHIFRFVIDRTIDDQNNPRGACEWKWTWKYPKDRKNFGRYYELFALKHGRPSSAPMKDVYSYFRASNAKKVEGMNKRKALFEAEDEKLGPTA